MQHGYEPQVTSAPPIPETGVGSAVRSGGVTFGVILIVMGVAFLAAQFVPGVLMWDLWPLAIVMLGLAMMVTPNVRYGSPVERFSDGVGTAMIGLVLLGNTLEYVSWEVWLTLLSLWPVLLISGGIALLSKASGQEWMRALASVPLWITILYAVAVSWSGAPLPFDLPAPPSEFNFVPFPPFD